jgi:hypothetical protein
MRVLLVYNPKAGDGLDVDRIVSLVERAGHAVEAQSIKEDDWAQALDAEADLVAVAGGDGTVRKVLIELAGTGRVATLLPVGTANNIAQSLGLEEVDPDRLVHGWERGRMIRCDIGTVTFGDKEGPSPKPPAAGCSRSSSSSPMRPSAGRTRTRTRSSSDCDSSRTSFPKRRSSSGACSPTAATCPAST